jgi:hypothetical protein
MEKVIHKINKVVAENKTWRVAGFNIDAFQIIILICVLGVFVLCWQFHSPSFSFSALGVVVGLQWREILPAWRRVCSGAHKKAVPDFVSMAWTAQSRIFSFLNVKVLSSMLTRFVFFVCSIFIVCVQESLFSCVGFLAHICLSPRFSNTPISAC